ncbi:uncharacterized protein LOC120428125 [Culex pipiens pallens]|uniref:uncharacterized protein LOC120428125 n=1 Tax=Culex pipiens pallens TaxID=42434 RepID=UPI001953B548|nr:uncharacterized protein LOC120428125 [Culex pipiens pallens]
MESCEICARLPSASTDQDHGPESDSPQLDQSALPPEVWAEIFKGLSGCHLLRVRLVCHRWKDIVDSSSTLLAKYYVFFFCDIHDERSITLPPATNAHFEKVTMAVVCSWWPSFCQRLVELEFTRCEINVSVLLEMLKQIPNLKCLALSWEYCDIEPLVDCSVAVDFSLNKLEKLKLADVKSTEIFKVFQQLCCNLKSLNITWCCNRDFQHSMEIAKLVKGLQNTLEELTINGIDKVLIEVMKFDQLRLKKLALSELQPTSQIPGLIVQLCRLHPSLEHLDFMDSRLLFNKTQLNEMSQLLSNLKFLSYCLGSKPEHVDLTFLSNMPKLEILSFDGRTINNKSVLPDYRPNLKELHLEAIFFQDNSFQMCLEKMPNIQAIHIEGCSMDSWLHFLKVLGSLKHLRELKLHNMFPKETTRCYFDDLTALKSLILYSCKMSQDLLATLLSRCPSLHKLHMTLVKDALKDDVRRVICWKLPRLNELRVTMYIEVEGVERASRTDIRVVFDSLEQLRSAVTE